MYVWINIVLMTAVVDARISVLPNATFGIGDESLTILCNDLSDDGFDTLYNIQLERDSVALGFIDMSGLHLISPNTSSKYEITGEFRASSPSRSYLQLVIDKPSAEDQGNYTCSSVGVLSAKIITDTHRQYVKIEVVIEARISVFPNESFGIGDESLTILCNVLSEDGFNRLYNIQLERDTVALGFIDVRGPNLTSANTSSKYEITGDFYASSPTRSYLQLVINKPSADDQGTYRCSSLGLLSTGITDTHRQNVTVKDSSVSTRTSTVSTSTVSTNTSTVSTSTSSASSVTGSAVLSGCVKHQTFQIVTLTVFFIFLQ
ncbi:uncharacterized protein LOC126829288 isoform X2 [Patella vulgata]|uniref:uncharacterized protein LOC126829288 isoform X2 n=1 Tax=Patella vulgata TaxID=6465 RepID=UPI0024A7A6C0|nr:uncharacterized protein LOC126829288 isoform X2 [Patella vulgata]